LLHNLQNCGGQLSFPDENDDNSILLSQREDMHNYLEYEMRFSTNDLNIMIEPNRKKEKSHSLSLGSFLKVFYFVVFE